jgi:ABC-2 type transport system ATP-binding protein
MSPVVVTQALTKRYGSRLAVDAVSFDVRPGEVVGLLGPNGSGKSTILRILTGYLQPTSGSASVGGFDVVAHGLEARRRVGYVPEDVPLYTQMRVTEFLAFMGRLRGIDGAALARAIDSACDRLALAPVRELLIAKLSRGYRQRVAIAQAVLHGPQLLVLDEPTNGLDPRQIIELRGLIRSLADGCAVLVTSHILAEIERVAHRAAILLDGRLLTIQQLGGGSALPWLRVRVRAASTDAARTALSAAQGVRAVHAEGASSELSTWRVQVEGERAAEDIAASLCGAGMGVAEITEAGSDLEALFLELTGGQPGAERRAA